MVYIYKYLCHALLSIYEKKYLSFFIDSDLFDSGRMRRWIV